LSTQSHNVFDLNVQTANYSSQDRSSSDPWKDFSEIFRGGQQPLPKVWEELFGPLRNGTVDDLMIVGQLGQSLDGRIATESGHSKYINGPGGLAHLHRLRALVDAVVIGVGSAVADDPQLTVRRVAGPHPARVVIDPNGRLGAHARLFADDGVRRLLFTAQSKCCELSSGVEVVTLPVAEGQLAPSAILAELASRGMRRILIEGGADTISRFLAAGCLDRLHVMVAPIILGNGGPGLILPSLERADQAPRMPIRVHRIDDDVLFDCDLSAQRVAIGAAKKSM
jgi:diaminohydroxyphosphoribosylaminopyrimidine deaminase / 5-amino-6-(5-phosphoribosylamino)uracil reductase